MRIGLLASNAAMAEYFVAALGIANHAVTMYPARQDLFSALAAAALQEGRAPHDVLLLELILDNGGRQILAGLSRLAKELGLPIKVGLFGRRAGSLVSHEVESVCSAISGRTSVPLQWFLPPV